MNSSNDLRPTTPSATASEVSRDLSAKKAYATPRVEVFGDVRTLTGGVLPISNGGFSSATAFS